MISVTLVTKQVINYFQRRLAVLAVHSEIKGSLPVIRWNTSVIKMDVPSKAFKRKLLYYNFILLFKSFIIIALEYIAERYSNY